MAKKQSQSSTPIESVRHKDKRANIPTEELRDFMGDEEKNPKTVVYERDTSLDPQLVWKGKDEQDQKPLEVPTVPIYIQEKIHPHAIIENFRTQVQKENQQQLSLFGDFNGLEFERLIDFYQHKEGVKWTNRMILGDSLLVMNSFAEKEGLKGKVQMIYIDPPYGIKFGSNWQVSTWKRDVKDAKMEDVTRQPEQVKAFRDTWEKGIHSYLAYLRDRLVVARELLTETGSVFVQIGDENVHLVRNVMDEVFGAENHVVTITVKKKGSQKSSLIDPVNDYLLWYSKTSRHAGENAVKFRKILEKRDLDAETLEEFRNVELSDGRQYPISAVLTEDEKLQDYRLRPQQLFKDHIGARLFRAFPITNGGERKNQSLPLWFEGKLYNPPKGRCWSHTARTDDGSPSGMDRVALAGRLVASGKALDFKRYLGDFGFKTVSNWWDGLGGASDQIYVVQTNPEIVKRCMLMTTDPGDLVLDPTCGSGTTAYVAEQWGRRWITIDTSRVALALARARLMTAKYSYYLLADSPEGIQKEAEITGQLPTQTQTEGNLKKGFVCKRIARVTSAAIANNPEIDIIHAKWQEQLEPIRIDLNQLLKKSWEEWEIPREPQEKWLQQAKDQLALWWDLRLSRQKEIDDAIARNSDTEILYDQPYEDNKRLRVTGPFTVESLSPHRVLSTDDERPASEAEGQQQASDQFEVRIIENLKKAGVQNTVKNERLKFDHLEPYSGIWLHATGEYTEKDETVKRVAISIGPEYGTVGSEQIKEAAKEAVKGLGCDLLIVCGFAFDPSVSEESKRYGKLTVLTTRMNSDLLLGEELLKKTGAGNLFMVFGEPDIEVKRQDAALEVTLNGLDIYDPTTGEIRSSSTDDIACWFIDTDYNGESFFVRHAYFTGADQPYDKLKRALKAEIDEDAWSVLYSTTSRPFEPPKGKDGKPGKIAIKVINHYGDEVLKVYEVK